MWICKLENHYVGQGPSRKQMAHSKKVIEKSLMKGIFTKLRVKAKRN